MTGCLSHAQVLAWIEMSRYIVNISGVGPSRQDISKIKSNEGKYKKISVNINDISSIYQLFTDISDTMSVTNAVHGTKSRILQF